jgi:hypothetical protein
MYMSDAIIAYQQAILLDPGNSLAHCARVVWICLFGKDGRNENQEYHIPDGYHSQVM